MAKKYILSMVLIFITHSYCAQLENIDNNLQAISQSLQALADGLNKLIASAPTPSTPPTLPPRPTKPLPVIKDIDKFKNVIKGLPETIRNIFIKAFESKDNRFQLYASLLDEPGTAFNVLYTLKNDTYSIQDEYDKAINAIALDKFKNDLRAILNFHLARENFSKAIEKNTLTLDIAQNLYSAAQVILNETIIGKPGSLILAQYDANMASHALKLTSALAGLLKPNGNFKVPTNMSPSDFATNLFQYILNKEFQHTDFTKKLDRLIMANFVNNLKSPPDQFKASQFTSDNFINMLNKTIENAFGSNQPDVKQATLKEFEKLKTLTPATVIKPGATPLEEMKEKLKQEQEAQELLFKEKSEDLKKDLARLYNYLLSVAGSKWLDSLEILQEKKDVKKLNDKEILDYQGKEVAISYYSTNDTYNTIENKISVKEFKQALENVVNIKIATKNFSSAQEKNALTESFAKSLYDAIVSLNKALSTENIALEKANQTSLERVQQGAEMAYNSLKLIDAASLEIIRYLKEDSPKDLMDPLHIAAIVFNHMLEYKVKFKDIGQKDVAFTLAEYIRSIQKRPTIFKPKSFIAMLTGFLFKDFISPELPDVVKEAETQQNILDAFENNLFEGKKIELPFAPFAIPKDIKAIFPKAIINILEQVRDNQNSEYIFNIFFAHFGDIRNYLQARGTEESKEIETYSGGKRTIEFKNSQELRNLVSKNLESLNKNFANILSATLDFLEKSIYFEKALADSLNQEILKKVGDTLKKLEEIISIANLDQQAQNFLKNQKTLFNNSYIALQVASKFSNVMATLIKKKVNTYNFTPDIMVKDISENIDSKEQKKMITVKGLYGKLDNKLKNVFKTMIAGYINKELASWEPSRFLRISKEGTIKKVIEEINSQLS